MRVTLIFISAVLFSCGSSVQEEKQNDTLGTVSSKDALVEEAVQERNQSSESQVSYYNGLIGGKYSIEVTLAKSGDSLKGQYRYSSQSDFLTLKGVIENGEITIKEFDPSGKNTGTFKGKESGKDQIKGEWTNGKRTFDFVFTSKKQEEFSGSVTLATKEFKFRDGNCICSELLIPEVTKASTKEIADRINSHLSVTSFAGSGGEVCDCMDGQYPMGVVSGSFDVIRNQGNILSIQWCGETMGAYPDGFCSYRNFDLRNGNKIEKLSDVLMEGGINYIVSKVQSEMNARLKQVREDKEIIADAGDWINDLAAPQTYTKESLRTFSLSEKGVTIHNLVDFPHAVQVYEPDDHVFISYADLESWIRQDGVLGK